MEIPVNVDETQRLLTDGDYISERSLATAVFLSLKLGRTLFLEGEAGVGKTEVAKVLAAKLNRPLIRLQCYEGLDISSAVYEWNYARQMIEIRLAEAYSSERIRREELEKNIFSQSFLIKRPLLQALNGDPCVLLIDELDRADEPFEAYLLEILSDFQITIPELGSIKAKVVPIVVVTSNRTREIHDALKRRCLYHWVDYPKASREIEILRIKAPEISESLSQQIVRFIQKLRHRALFKAPGVAESIDWAHALSQLDVVSLSADIIDDTLGTLLKYQDDIMQIRGSEAAKLLEEINTELKRQTQ